MAFAFVCEMVQGWQGFKMVNSNLFSWQSVRCVPGDGHTIVGELASVSPPLY